MTDNNWDTYSEEMEEDLIMEDGDDEDMETSSGGAEKTVYEDITKGENSSVVSPGFHQLATPTDFSRFENSASPIHGFADAIDEKGDSIALLMHLEKTIVHQNFFDNFDDDFDDEDYA